MRRSAHDLHAIKTGRQGLFLRLVKVCIRLRQGDPSGKGNFTFVIFFALSYFDIKRKYSRACVAQSSWGCNELPALADTVCHAIERL